MRVDIQRCIASEVGILLSMGLEREAREGIAISDGGMFVKLLDIAAMKLERKWA